MKCDRRFYVYVGEHPVSGQTVYVGKGSNRRVLVHNYDLSRRKHRNKRLQKIYDEFGPLPWSKVRENLSEQEAFETEIALIAYFGRDRLCNYSEGGTGPSGHIHSAETKAKISARNKGLKRTKEQREIMSLLRRGTKMAAEARAKMSAAGKGRKFSEEHRAKIGAAHKGRKFSEESLAKMSRARKGRKIPDETRARMSSAKLELYAKRRGENQDGLPFFG